MAISKKGLRSITVDHQKYYWKFNEKIVIFPEGDPNCILTIDFGYFDIWLFVNDQEHRPPYFEPKPVTPKFVSESIQFALENNWKGKKMDVEYRNTIYNIKSN